MGIVLAITAACCYAASAVLARVGMSTGIKPSSGTFISMISSLIFAGVLALTINFEDITSLSMNAVLWFGLIGIITYFIGRQVNYAAIRRIGAARASPLFSTASLFALILAVAFLGERVNIPIIIGTLTIITGIYLVVSSR